MSLNKRLLLITTIWIVIILFIFSLFVYYSFIQMATNNEMRLLWNKAQILLRNPNVMDPKYWNARSGIVDEVIETNVMGMLVS